MNTLLFYWVALGNILGVFGALMVLIYAGALVVGLVALVVAIVSAIRQWRRERAVQRILREQHEAAYRERRGGQDAA